MYQIPRRASNTGAFLSRGAERKCLSWRQRRKTMLAFFGFSSPSPQGPLRIVILYEWGGRLIIVHWPSSGLLTKVSQNCQSLMRKLKHRSWKNGENSYTSAESSMSTMLNTGAAWLIGLDIPALQLNWIIDADIEKKNPFTHLCGRLCV